MIGYAYNKKTGKVDMAGEYGMVKAFTDPNCYEVLTAEELDKKNNNE
jgi:hypothetical protein